MKPSLLVLSLAMASLGALELRAQELLTPRQEIAPNILVIARPDDFTEQTRGWVNLAARVTVEVQSYEWKQVAGPRVPLTTLELTRAYANVSSLEVAVDTELVFQLAVQTRWGPFTGSTTVRVRPATIEPVLGPYTQIGGASTAVVTFESGGVDWALFNVGSRLSATQLGVPQPVTHSIQVRGTVKDIELVDYGAARYALLATGGEGIAVVDVTNPTQMRWLVSVDVNYYQSGLTWTEGGGEILYDQEIAGTKGSITALETDGSTLWIANADYGLHRTALANLLNSGGPVLEADGTLKIEHEAYTLQYAGEVPWGGPQSVKLVDGKLFVALEFLGLAIYDSTTFDRVGAYNLYTDVAMHEDWFLDMDVANEVQPGFLDPVTGMPDYRQASFEITNSHGSGGTEETFPTPWADFDKYGKYYYNSRVVDVVRYASPDRTLAYIAYGLGGLVAVDVTGFETATSGSFLQAVYQGYAPGVPAHGPEELIGTHFQTIFPRFGSGMLKETGVVDVVVFDDKAYYTDHFGGLAVIDGADDPMANWHGVAAPYDNDNGIPGDHIPDYEFVTSYDMSPYDPADHESLPTWMYEQPNELVTGEVGGHGNRLVLMPNADVVSPGGVDVLLCLGSGGFTTIDVALSAPVLQNRFAVLDYFPTTSETGAAADGSPTQAISIGHSQGITASERYLYLADGPHGVSAWKLVDELGYPTDYVHLVANTVQDEYPVVVGSNTVYPATHANGVVFDERNNSVLALCQGVGMRRIDATGVEDGTAAVGAPLLIAPKPTDIFEHNGEWGKISSVPKQDHAFDVAIAGRFAFVADGGNGVTIYDLTKDPTNMNSGFFVANLGGATMEKPLMGRATGIALWHKSDRAMYAIVAAGPFGVGVADVTDPYQPELVKIFEPIKIEDEKVGKADGRCVDVIVEGSYAYFTYDSFGVLCYSLADLIEPLPAGVSPTEIWKVTGGVVEFDYRPVALGEFRLREDPVYADLGGGALYMDHTYVEGVPVLYVGYGVAGIVKLSWADPKSPVLQAVVPTADECTAIAVAAGRIYAADALGGLVYFK